MPTRILNHISLLCLANYFIMELQVAAETVAIQESDRGDNGRYKKVCYYTNWSQYRQRPARYFPYNIDPHKCTHIIFSFAKIDYRGQLAPYEWNDMEYPYLYRQFNNLKKKNRKLKTLLAIGGWTHGSAPFAAVVKNSESRRSFIEHSIQYLRSQKFDGMDLDWEYPANRGSPPEDKENFSALLREMRQLFEEEAKKSGMSRLLMTAAVGGGTKVIESAYEVDQLAKYLDFINLMTYDLHGGWEKTLGINAPLYSRKDEVGDGKETKNADWVVRKFIEMGAPPEKIVLGIPFYGRSFTLCSNEVKPGQPNCGIGAKGPYTKEKGFLSYYEIVLNFQRGWIREWDDEAKAPYAYSISEKQWVGYDDMESIYFKAQYVKEHNLGGIMVWALDLDDFANIAADGAPYPLLRAINDVLDDENDIPVLPHATSKVHAITKKMLDNGYSTPEIGWMSSVRIKAKSTTASITARTRKRTSPITKIIPNTMRTKKEINTRYTKLDKTTLPSANISLVTLPKKQIRTTNIPATLEHATVHSTVTNLATRNIHLKLDMSSKLTKTVPIPSSRSPIYTKSKVDTTTQILPTIKKLTTLKSSPSTTVKNGHSVSLITATYSPPSSKSNSKRTELTTQRSTKIYSTTREVLGHSLKKTFTGNYQSRNRYTSERPTTTKFTARNNNRHSVSGKHNTRNASSKFGDIVTIIISPRQKLGDDRLLKNTRVSSNGTVAVTTYATTQKVQLLENVIKSTSQRWWQAQQFTLENNVDNEQHWISSTRKRYATRKEWKLHTKKRHSTTPKVILKEKKQIINTETNEISDSEIIISGFMCPTLFGLYEDMKDCTKFYQCVWFIPFQYNCGKGTAWNNEYKICDWPYAVGCKL